LHAYDRSEKKSRTENLFDKTLGILLILINLAELPIMKPLHRGAAESLRVPYGEP
jgi:hypothetical protein